MRPRILILLALLTAGTGAAAWSWSSSPLARAADDAAASHGGQAADTEEQWIVTDVIRAISDVSRAAGPRADTRGLSFAVEPAAQSDALPVLLVTLDESAEPVRYPVTDHLWSPGVYARLVGPLLGQPRRDEVVELNARGALTDLRATVLLEQSQRVSAALMSDIRSPAAHEAAALLVTAFTLRETTSGLLSDTRPALSRITAHLAVAEALRGPGPPTTDGTLARIGLAALVGRERDALVALDAVVPASPADRAWVRALRWRVTGDWREATPDSSDTRLEQLEYARALRVRKGIDAFLDRMDDFPLDAAADWHRIAFLDRMSIEAGHRFAYTSVQLELAEAEEVWSRLHGAPPPSRGLVAALNTRAANTPIQPNARGHRLEVLDWGLWAGFLQRRLCESLLMVRDHRRNLGQSEDEHAQMVTDFEERFGDLTLFPVVLRRIAQTRPEYERAMAGARPIALRSPELLTQDAWTLLLTQPAFAPVAQFPFDAGWFTPAVPAGTAFDLAARSLRPGCRRPATRAQAAIWSHTTPHEYWTVWGGAWLAVDGKPSRESVERAFGPLLAYDRRALLLMLEYLDGSPDEHTAVAKLLCDVSPGECNRFAHLLFTDGQEEKAVAAFEQWIERSRDTVGVSNNVQWLVRHYYERGNPARAEEIARLAADTGSARGLETFAHLLDRAARYDEAEQVYRRIAESYGDSVPLGTFLLRQSLRTGDKETELRAWELLRRAFPLGIEELAPHALDAPPKDGVAFKSFGRRASALGVLPSDVIVGVDRWRVRTVDQYLVVSRLRHDEMMTLTVWRQKRYEQLRLRVPERLFGADLRNSTPS